MSDVTSRGPDQKRIVVGPQKTYCPPTESELVKFLRENPSDLDSRPEGGDN